MFLSKRFLVFLPAVLLFGLLTVPTSALAHERRTVAGGKYDVVVGWDVEPAFTSEKNAASIRISKAGSDPAEPIEGADKTLKLQLKQGASTRDVPLRAVFGQKGYYVADFVPTRAGDYQWTFTGAINGDPVNETFDTADGKFDKVGPIADLQFPVAAADSVQLAAATQAAQADAQSARTLAYVGIGLGVVGLLAALGAWATRPRLTAVTPARPATERV